MQKNNSITRNKNKKPPASLTAYGVPCGADARIRTGDLILTKGQGKAYKATRIKVLLTYTDY
jgi:hypothetical protein